MSIMKFAILGVAVLFAISCEPLEPYPPVSRDFRPYGPEADRLRAQGRLPQTRNEDPYRSYERPSRRLNDANVRREPPRRGPQIDTSYDPGAPAAPPRRTRSSYPTAQRTANRDQVLSPYAPYNVIDVEGFKTGQLAKDPSNGKIFRVP